MLLIAIAAFDIWFAQSRLCCNCFLEFSWRPQEGTWGTGSHHFSSCLWKEDEPSLLGAITPWSTYLNSVLTKLSSISYIERKWLENFAIKTELMWIKCRNILQEACYLIFAKLADWYKDPSVVYKSWPDSHLKMKC